MGENTVANKPRKVLGTKIKNLRESRGLRQEDVALKTGLSQTTLSRIENGDRGWKLKYKQFQYLCNVCKPTLGDREELNRLYESIFESNGNGSIQRVDEEGLEALERSATTVQSLSLTTIPACLQTEVYAAKSFDEIPDMRNSSFAHEATEFGYWAMLRGKRSEVFRDTNKNFQFVISECAMQMSLLGNTDDVDVQLMSLRRISRLPMAEVLVCADKDLERFGVPNEFSVLDSSMVVVHTFTDNIVFDDERVLEYTRVFQAIVRASHPVTDWSRGASAQFVDISDRVPVGNPT